MGRELDSHFIGKNIYIDIRKPAQVHRNIIRRVHTVLGAQQREAVLLALTHSQNFFSVVLQSGTLSHPAHCPLVLSFPLLALSIVPGVGEEASAWATQKLLPNAP